MESESVKRTKTTSMHVCGGKGGNDCRSCILRNEWLNAKRKTHREGHQTLENLNVNGG